MVQSKQHVIYRMMEKKAHARDAEDDLVKTAGE